jgi:hypothetical protein
MSKPEDVLSATSEDVYNWMNEIFRQRIQLNHKESMATYGFDVFLPNLITNYLSSNGIERDQQGQFKHRIAPIFLNAAWEMCLRGILRPSWSNLNDQHPTGPGYGYSYTEEGRKWLQDPALGAVLYSTGRMGELFAQYRARFGDGYHERAQESLRCYSARAYFGCCAMCGAAAESILLKLAIQKLNDEEKALQIYHGRQGRKELKDKVLELGQKPEGIRNELGAGFTILSYWRDDAAHGSALNVTSTQANVAMQMLCLFALAADKHWDYLTN